METKTTMGWGINIVIVVSMISSVLAANSYDLNNNNNFGGIIDENSDKRLRCIGCSSETDTWCVEYPSRDEMDEILKHAGVCPIGQDYRCIKGYVNKPGNAEYYYRGCIRNDDGIDEGCSMNKLFDEPKTITRFRCCNSNNCNSGSGLSSETWIICILSVSALLNLINRL